MKSLCLLRFLSHYIVLLHLILIDIISLSVVTNRWLLAPLALKRFTSNCLKSLILQSSNLLITIFQSVSLV